MKTSITSINDILTLHQKYMMGKFFESNSFWCSQYHDVFPGGVFTTSERTYSGKHMFSVRNIDSEGAIHIIQEFDTLSKASSMARRYCEDNNLKDFSV